MVQNQIQYDLLRKFISHPKTAPFIELISEVYSCRVKGLPTNAQRAAFYFNLEKHLFDKIHNSRYIFPNPDIILLIGMALVGRVQIATERLEQALISFPPVIKLAEERLRETLEKNRHVLSNFYFANLPIDGEFLMTSQEAARPVEDTHNFARVFCEIPQASGFERGGDERQSPLNEKHYKDVEKIQRAILESLPTEVFFNVERDIDDVNKVKAIDCLDERMLKDEYHSILSRYFHHNPTSYVSLYCLIHKLRKIGMECTRAKIDGYIPPTSQLIHMPEHLFDVSHPFYEHPLYA